MPTKGKGKGKKTRKNNRKAGDVESMYKFAIGDKVMWRVNRVYRNFPNELKILIGDMQDIQLILILLQLNFPSLLI